MESTVVGTDDHGLIAAYIKSDGKVYYRNLCEQEDGKLIWDLERQVAGFSGNAVNLNLFITNDYRTGIIIENSQGRIFWFITSRNWAGMAIASDKIVARSNIKVEFIETTKHRVFKEEKISAGINTKVNFCMHQVLISLLRIENIDNGEGDFGKEIFLLYIMIFMILMLGILS